MPVSQVPYQVRWVYLVLGLLWEVVCLSRRQVYRGDGNARRGAGPYLGVNIPETWYLGYPGPLPPPPPHKY